MKNESKKAKARYLQNLIRDRIKKLFPSLGPDDIRCSLMSENGADVKLTSLMAAITTASNSLLSNSTTNVQETQAQNASKEAFTDISDTVKTIVEEQEFKPTITIDQGTPVKIYVNKDYKFPKAAISKSRRLK